jgi:hypothetical protein
VVKGRGGYFTDMLKGIAKKGVDWLSSKAHNLIDGYGDYSEHSGAELKIDQNTLCSGSQTPEIHNKGQAYIVRHREYIMDVLPSVGFANTILAINPADPLTFPWLRNIAAAFEQWEIIGGLVEYQPTIGEATANAQGFVTISTQYNPTKAPFVSDVQAQNADYATSVVVTKPMLHAIECAPAETAQHVKDVLLGALPPNQDLRLYSHGNVNIINSGQANTTGSIGKIFFIYEIVFYKPLFTVGLGLTVPTDHIQFNWISSGTNLFATNSAIQHVPGSSLLTTLGAGNTITFPTNISLGTYMVAISLAPTANWSASSTWNGIPTVTPLPVGTVPGCTILNLWSSPTALDQNGIAPQGVATVTATQCSAMAVFFVSINAPGNVPLVITLPLITVAVTNNGKGDVFITQINGNVLS